jgi:alpha-galactosidase/6-phospho-beta-glucosidase family protein
MQQRKAKDEELRHLLESTDEIPISHSAEYGAIVIHAMETGTKIFQAILLDPLTGPVLTIEAAHRMVDEMFEAGSAFLKDYN